MKCLFILAIISMDIALKVNPSNILIIVSGLYERCYPVAVERLWCSVGSDPNEFFVNVSLRRPVRMSFKAGMF